MKVYVVEIFDHVEKENWLHGIYNTRRLAQLMEEEIIIDLMNSYGYSTRKEVIESFSITITEQIVQSEKYKAKRNKND